MKKRLALLWVFSAAVLISAPALARTERFDKVIDKAFGASDLNQVRIYAETVRVEGVDSDSVVVHAEYHVEAKGWLFFGSASYDLEFQKSGRTLLIHEIEGDNWNFGIWINRSTNNQVVVQVPHSLAVEVQGDDGAIRLCDLSGPVRAEFEDGRLEAENITGPDFRLDFEDGSAKLREIHSALEVEFEDGSLNAEDITSSKIRLHFEDGSAKLRNVHSALQTEFEDGSLRIWESDLSALRLNFSDGRADIESGVLGEGPYKVRFNDGRFEWTFPGVPDADIEAKVYDGSITADFPGLEKTSHRKHFRYSFGGGGTSVDIHADDGYIHLEALPETRKRVD